jgi:predicted MFS family arabinose efflux permease
LGSGASPERNLAIFLISVFLSSSIALKLLPMLVVRFGDAALFIALACIALVGLLQSLSLKAGGVKRTDVSTVSGSMPKRSVGFVHVVSVASVLFFFMGVGAVWTYFGQIGAQASLKASDVANGMSLAVLAGGLGALFALFIANKVSRWPPLFIGLAFALLAMFLVFGEVNALQFAVAGAMIMFGWNFSYPFMLGILAQLDVSGRLVAMGVAMSNFGFAGGPALAGLFFGAVVVAKVPLMGAGWIALSVLSVVSIWPALRAKETQQLSDTGN